MLVKCIPAGELEESYRKEVAPSALYMMLQVVDAGCGIPPQERDKVFTPFYRVPETAGVNVPGTGIGLSLVYSIVKLHKGVIRIEDREDGTEGARLIVLLPVSREAFTEEETDSMPVETIGDTAFAQPLEKLHLKSRWFSWWKMTKMYGITCISPWKMTMKSLKRQMV